MTEAIEIVVFRPAAGVTGAKLQEAAAAVSPALAGLPGFISREFGVSEDGRYVDVVRWKDLSAAKAAANAAMQIPQCETFFRLIDHDQMRLMHFEKIG